MESNSRNENNDLYSFGPFCLNPAERRLTRDGEILNLRPKAFDLLLMLVREPRHVKSRQSLIEALWPDTIVEEHNLTVNINQLRKLLGGESKQAYIETVRGYGYRFVMPVKRVDESQDNQQPEQDHEHASSADSDSRSLPPTHTARGRTRPFLIAGGLIVIAAALIAYFSLRPLADKIAKDGDQQASIAVLPFENLSPNRRNAYFVRGIQDLIITKLAGIDSLKVISRTSTEGYPSHPVNLGKVARQLGVKTILEGSVQMSDGHVLINLQLIDARTNSHLWAQAYKRKLDNVFDVESKVAREVANALKLELFPQEARRLARVPTDNPKAYDLFLRADYLAAKVETRKADNPQRAGRRALSLFRKALAQDPGFALAQARLSILSSYLYWYGIDHRRERIREARQAASAAIGSGLAQGHLAMGYVYYRGYRNYDKAIEEFKIARHMRPNSVEALGAIAFVQRRRGQWQAALEKLHRAEILDPRNPLWHQARGETLAQLRRYDEALKAFTHAFSVAPHYYLALIYKTSVQLLSGHPEKAQKILETIPDNAHMRGMLPATRFSTQWLLRRPEKALAALDDTRQPAIAALFMIGDVPTNLLRARAWSLKGNSARAKTLYLKARGFLADSLKRRPQDAKLMSYLAMVEASLGHADKAINHARQAIQLLPVSEDAFYGPSHLTALAVTYAKLNKPASAVRVLKKLLSIPAGLSMSAAMLRQDPIWDPIRNTPEFQALLRQFSVDMPPVYSET